MVISDTIAIDINFNSLVSQTRSKNSPSNNEEIISQRFADHLRLYHSDFLAAHNLSTVKINFEKRGNKLYITGFVLIYNDGRVEHVQISPVRYDGNIYSHIMFTTLRKVEIVMAKQLARLPIGKIGATAALLIGLTSFISMLLGINGFSRPGAVIIFALSLYSAFVCWKADNARSREN